PPDLDAVYRLVVVEPPLFRALRDLVETITVPHIACVNCGRVIDSICRMISPSLRSAAAWQAMHQALNISRQYQQWISDQATGPRHGDSSFVPGNIDSEVVRRSWTIMDRFLEYRQRSNLPLAAPEFPTL